MVAAPADIGTAVADYGIRLIFTNRVIVSLPVVILFSAVVTLKPNAENIAVTCAKLGADGKVILSDVIEKGDYVAMLCEFSDRPGDMDNDGIMNAKDASAILKDIVGLEPGKNPLMADFNGDGKVNAMDASAILKRIVGLA